MSALGKRRADGELPSKSKLPYRSGKGRFPSTTRSPMLIAREKAYALNRRGLRDKETGFVDSLYQAWQFDTTGTIVHLNVVAQGAAVNQRIGKKIKLKSLACRGFVGNGVTAAFNDCAILIVYDRRPTGSLPNITDILNTADSHSFNNDANSGRFQILKRMDFTLVGNGAVAGQITDTSYDSADFFLNLRGLPCTFKAAATGTIGDVEEGALYCVTVGNTAASTAAAVLNAGFRTRFIDI